MHNAQIQHFKQIIHLQLFTVKFYTLKHFDQTMIKIER